MSTASDSTRDRAAPAPSTDLDQATRQWVDRIRESVRAEVRDAIDVGALEERLRSEIGTGGGAAEGDPAQVFLDRASEIFAQEPVKAAINTMIQDALQAVLPSLVKRFRTEMQKAFTELGGGVNIEDVVNSTEMKEMLEDRFRHMLLYLKQEVIPKAMG